MTLLNSVTQLINDLKQKLNQHNRQDELVFHLQQHTSFVCQSESLNDYFNETEKLIKICLTEDNQDERLNDKLNDQISLLGHLATHKSFENQIRKSDYKSRIGLLHQKLAQYQQYLSKFDDQIRLHPDLPKDHSIFTRREKCIAAIESVEKKLMNRDWMANKRQF